MTTTRGARKVRCSDCQEFGHVKRDCTNGKKERFDTRKWCSLHNSTTHSDTECKAQKGKKDTNTAAQGKVHSAHTMTGPTPKEVDLGYAFATPPLALLWEGHVLPRPQSVPHTDTWMNRLHFLL